MQVDNINYEKDCPEPMKFEKGFIGIKEDLRSLMNVIYLSSKNFSNENSGFKKVPTEKGYYYYKVILFKNFLDGISVYDATAEKGTISKLDSHSSNNLIFVYKGKVNFYIKDDKENRYEKFELSAGKILKINKNKEHYAEFLEETFMIGIYYPPMYI